MSTDLRRRGQTDPTSYARTTSATARRDAIRDVVAVAPALLPLGITLGVFIASSITGDLAGLIGAPLVYGGTAQLTAATLFQHRAGALQVVGSAVTVSARLLVYSASLAPRFHSQPLWFRLAGAHFIIDQTYLSALDRPTHRGRSFRAYWLSLGFGVAVVWSSAVGLGLLVGPALPTLPHLTLAATALFTGMLVPRLRDSSSVTAASVAAVTALAVAQVIPMLSVVAGTSAGIAAGFATHKGRTQ